MKANFPDRQKKKLALNVSSLTSHLAISYDVGNDGRVLVNAYNIIIPHNESNSNARQGHLGQKQSRPRVGAALLDSVKPSTATLILITVILRSEAEPVLSEAEGKNLVFGKQAVFWAGERDSSPTLRFGSE